MSQLHRLKLLYRKAETQNEAAIVLAQTLKLANPCIVGHDIGGMVAYDYLQSSVLADIEIDNETEMVAGPDTVDRLVECEGGRLNGGARLRMDIP